MPGEGCEKLQAHLDCLRELLPLLSRVEGPAYRVAEVIIGEASEGRCHPLTFYALLKLLLESIAQVVYYRLLGVEGQELLQRVTRRSKAYASFTATMIARLRGVHASRRRWVMRVYLRLSEYTHPSTRLWRWNVGVEEDLVWEALDAILYLTLLGYPELRGQLHPRACRLDKSLRLLAAGGRST